jgi:hypothetical protein
MQANSLDIAAATAAQVTSLQLNRQGLERLPRDFTRRFPNLRQLYLNHNKLRSLPKRLFKLSQLRVLQLNHNQLTQLPDNLSTATQLRQLSLQANRLRQLPPLPPRLEVLDLSTNRLRELPPQLLAHTPLLHLSLAHNRLSRLPDKLASSWPALQYLDLSGLGLQALPPLPPRLYALHLSHNRLRAAPQELKALTHLQRLDLSQNPCHLHLDQLPTTLQYLDVRHTPTSWPTVAAVLEELPQLTHTYGGLSTRNQKKLSGFLHECSHRSSTMRLIDLWELWEGKVAPDLSTTHLLSTLLPTQADRLAATAHAHLCAKPARSFTALGQRRWTIVGQTGLSHERWKRQFRQRGIPYTDDLAEADGVLLGYSLQTVPELGSGQQIISEHNLLQLLAPLQGHHLTGSSGNSQEVVQLAQDINEKEETARILGLQRLRAFGTPGALLPSLLTQWDRLVREGYADILLPYLPPFFQRLLVFERRSVTPPPLRRRLDQQLWAARQASTGQP